MKKIKIQLTIKEIAGLFLFYIVLLVCWGYQFGDGDLIQLDPLVLSMTDDSLYANDFYVQHANEHFPNERSFFLLLLTPFSNNIETASFVYHIIFSMLLLTGLFSISKLFIKNKLLLWFVLPVLFIPLININLGTNELYYPFLHPSLTAKAIGAWALYFWLQRKIIYAFILVSLSTLQHPVVGIQLFLLLSAGEIFIFLFRKNERIKIKQTITALIIYISTAGIFIISIQLRFRDSNVDHALFYKIFFEFRNPHHYLPSSFSAVNWVVLVPLILLSCLIFQKKNKYIFIFICLAITGCVIYTIMTEIFHSTAIAPIQWFKTTIWLEFFSVIGLAVSFELLLNSSINILLKRIISMTIGFAFLAIIIFIPIYKYQKMYTGYYNFPFNRKITPEIEISIKAKELIPKNALFIQPCNFTTLKYYGERSSLVDYKALTHRKSFILEWAKRFEDVYDLKIEESPIGLKTSMYANNKFKNLSADYISQLQEKYGITHLLTFKTSKYPFPIIAQNEVYVIYEIEDQNTKR
ncbi:MAG: hypothetical protein H7Y00_13165 [Fimbriimonadaceae bacterium]|nr:hypothetical protein [Chitinophagales bacterium]